MKDDLVKIAERLEGLGLFYAVGREVRQIASDLRGIAGGENEARTGDRVLWKNCRSEELSGSIIEIMRPKTTYSIQLDNGALIVEERDKFRKQPDGAAACPHALRRQGEAPMTKPTKLAKATTMAPCPKCGCPDVHADSSSAAEASWIDCEGCDYRFQKRCDEETLVEKWNAINRKKMPDYNDGGDQ